MQGARAWPLGAMFLVSGGILTLGGQTTKIIDKGSARAQRATNPCPAPPGPGSI
jgi:hypothetical protein